jgi:hypothetical protein
MEVTSIKALTELTKDAAYNSMLDFYDRFGTIHLCHQKPNIARETVTLSCLFH